MIYGYARVSTDGQTLDSQIAALTAAGAEKVFSEKQSGAKTDRAQLAKAIAALNPDDVLLVTRLDRLARSTRDLLNTLAQIGDRQAAFRSLSDAWADTTTAHGRLMLTVLGGLAEFERALILARTSDGRARAKARGVRFGRMAACKEEAKGMKFSWHWRKRQKYVQNCIIRSASKQGIDIWEIRRAVNMKDLPSQDIDDWTFVFSRSRNR
jgi:DNA invertase Pin-like site-specific DNA recombinase